MSEQTSAINEPLSHDDFLNVLEMDAALPDSRDAFIMSPAAKDALDSLPPAEGGRVLLMVWWRGTVRGWVNRE